MADMEGIKNGVINGKAEDVENLVKQAVDEGTSADDVIKGAMIPAMGEVGDKMKNNEFFIPEVLIAAKAMQAGMKILKPLLAKEGVSAVGKVVIGTVKGDLHDIGKNLISMMLEGAGFEVTDLGIDVPAEKFIEAVKSKGANIIGMSALLTTTMPMMKSIIDEMKNAGVRDGVKVIIGGAAITQEYADEIGADAYAEDAATGVQKAKALIGAA